MRPNGTRLISNFSSFDFWCDILRRHEKSIRLSVEQEVGGSSPPNCTRPPASQTRSGARSRQRSHTVAIRDPHETSRASCTAAIEMIRTTGSTPQGAPSGINQRCRARQDVADRCTGASTAMPGNIVIRSADDPESNDDTKARRA